MRGPRRLPLRLRFYRRRPGAWDWAFAAWMILGPPLAQRLFLGSIDWSYLAIFDALFLPSLFVGARLDGGSRKQSASTGTKVLGTRTRETGTSGASSFLRVRGPGSVAVSVQTWLPLASSYSEHGLSTGATATLGVSGAPRERAV